MMLTRKSVFSQPKIIEKVKRDHTLSYYENNGDI
jgi:hypothetical protein